MKLVESGIGVIVAVIMIFALGQGNLKKNVNGQEEFQPESGTSADISEIYKYKGRLLTGQFVYP